VKKISILLSVLFYAQSASAILDGRAAPIYLDTRYTFTNYEWARGSVFFRDGFDVAPGGTIFLGMEGGLVQQNIELNGGTICLENDLNLTVNSHMTGSGFIDGNFKSITYRRGFPGLFEGSGYIKLLSHIILNGNGPGAVLDPGQTLDLRGMGGILSVNNIRVALRSDRILTDVASPSSIRFNSCYITQAAPSVPFVFTNPEIIFSGDTSLTTNSKLVIENLLTILEGGRVDILSSSFVQLGGLNVRFSADLEARNSILDFVSTGTSPIRIGDPQPSQGKLSFVGQTIFRSSSGNELRVDPALSLEFLSGSRLILDEGVHLTIE
jgi:hypothetical protein